MSDAPDSIPDLERLIEDAPENQLTTGELARLILFDASKEFLDANTARLRSEILLEVERMVSKTPNTDEGWSEFGVCLPEVGWLIAPDNECRGPEDTARKLRFRRKVEWFRNRK